ncbi:MmpS family transport accessory protein [Paractinoplanes atraurantiacus]|uniref:Membrane protein n=1 Tax=Paractinoplanes atraurantiacus TaxID=1036182 RepID=A0A285IXQ3_9ACTN|nr:MmpS family transport accessory protein [Actinoplanes atraurantiacus]SNY51876.1 membrane protein [Actinoplanes atraurantiacus]
MSSNTQPDQSRPDPGRTTPGDPTFSPGYASLPQPPDPDYPPTSEFPATASDNVPPGYPPPGYGTPYDPYDGGYPPPAGPTQRPPRKSNVPIVAVIIAVTLLLCGGVGTAGVLIARNVTEKAKEAVAPITGLPSVKPELPAAPTGGPGFGAKVSVTYEVTGDGPASQLLYVESLSESPQRLESVQLPWKFTGEIDTPTVLNVTAFRLGDPDGTISCRVLVNGEEVARNTSDPGTFGTVTCNHFAFE